MDSQDAVAATAWSTKRVVVAHITNYSVVLNDTRRHVEARRAPQLLLLFQRPFSRRGHALAAHAPADVRLAIMIGRRPGPRVALDRILEGGDVVDPVRRDVQYFTFSEYGINRTGTFGRKRLLRL